MHLVFNHYHYRRTGKPLKGKVDMGRLLLQLVLGWGAIGYFTEEKSLGVDSLWKP